MDFISKAGSCVVDNASKALRFVGSKLPNRTPKNAAILIWMVGLFSARNRIANSRIANITLNALSVVGSKLPNPTLKNAAILIVVVALLFAAFKETILDLFTCSTCRSGGRYHSA